MQWPRPVHRINNQLHMSTSEPNCAICLSPMAPGAENCPVCGAEVDEISDDASIEAGESAEWEIVRTFSTNVEAEITAGRLRSEGIPAIVLSQVDTTRNLTVGALAIAKLFVRTTDLEEAEAILSTPGPDPDQYFSDGNGEE